MGKSIMEEYSEVPVTEIRKQLEYARVVCEDLFNEFSLKEAKGRCCASKLGSTQTKLSMLIDFISDASCWCSMLELNQMIDKEGEKKK